MRTASEPLQSFLIDFGIIYFSQIEWYKMEENHNQNGPAVSLSTSSSALVEGRRTGRFSPAEDSWGSTKILKNLIVVSSAFFLLFTAFMVSIFFFFGFGASSSLLNMHYIVYTNTISVSMCPLIFYFKTNTKLKYSLQYFDSTCQNQ